MWRLTYVVFFVMHTLGSSDSIRQIKMENAAQFKVVFVCDSGVGRSLCSPSLSFLQSTPQCAAANVAAHINPGCKDLEEDRGGKGSCTEERGQRKVWGLAELATQCFRCCRNTTVVTTVVKSQKLVFEKFFKFYCYYRCICFATYQLYSSLRTTMST